MNEFSLIDRYFKNISFQREDVILGIGDDAACLRVPVDMDLVVSTDTLVEGVHFLADWDAYDIATRAVLVNVSDMAAMGAIPCWTTLALTLPSLNEGWLQRYSKGLADSLGVYQIALVGGDTTRGPLTMTLTMHGLVPKGRGIKRSGAKVGDLIMVSGDLGAAALAVSFLDKKNELSDEVVKKLLQPTPRVDLRDFLLQYATSAIDISDGLAADLNHILQASQVGACINLEKIPVHPTVKQHHHEFATEFALRGGDDYELCFTSSPDNASEIERLGLSCHCIGIVEAELGLRAVLLNGDKIPLATAGYSHF